MGPQQVLRAAACTLLIGGVAAARPREKVAVIDLGPGDAGVRRQLAGAIVGGKLEPVIGDGVEDALGGVNVDRDGLQLAAALAQAQTSFGALACKEATAAAQTAIAIGAARQAAAMPAPELPRAWSYVLLCADRGGDAATAIGAAARLRELGGSPDVDASVLARYPDVDALSNREVIDIEVKAEVDGADVWVDFKRAGKSPLKLSLAAGPHVIAAAAGSRRGSVTGTVIKKQPVVAIPMPDQAGPWAAVAARVAGWHGTLPPPAELEAVMAQVKARVALVRHGDTVEAWGHAGRGEPLRRLGNDDGIRKLSEADALVALVRDRIQGWEDRAPDPDQPLLLDTKSRRGKEKEEEPTRWWVYATIAGALVAGAIVIYAHDHQQDTQHVELKYP